MKTPISRPPAGPLPAIAIAIAIIAAGFAAPFAVASSAAEGGCRITADDQRPRPVRGHPGKRVTAPRAERVIACNEVAQDPERSSKRVAG